MDTRRLLVTLIGQADYSGVHRQTAVVTVDRNTYEMLTDPKTEPLEMVDLWKPELLITDEHDNRGKDEVPTCASIKRSLVQAWIYAAVSQTTNLQDTDSMKPYLMLHKNMCGYINYHLNKYNIIIHNIVVVKGRISISDSDIIKSMSAIGVAEMK